MNVNPVNDGQSSIDGDSAQAVIRFGLFPSIRLDNAQIKCSICKKVTIQEGSAFEVKRIDGVEPAFPIDRSIYRTYMCTECGNVNLQRPKIEKPDLPTGASKNKGGNSAVPSLKKLPII